MQKQAKKVANIIKNIFVWLLAIAAVLMMIFTIISVTTFDRTDRNLFGYKAFIVLSDSMSATDFSAGDIVISKAVDPSTLKEGDIVSYISQNQSNYGETVTHKIRKLTTNDKGEKGFITYGTTTDADDEIVVTYPYILGQYQGSIPKVGTFFHFLKSAPGYVCCILIPFLLLIGYHGIHCVKLFRKYKKEQIQALESERESIAKEREASLKMMAELQAMKEKIAEQEKKENDNLQV